MAINFIGFWLAAYNENDESHGCNQKGNRFIAPYTELEEAYQPRCFTA